MNILTSDEIRFLDAFTIQNEPIASIDLMERAAQACAHWMEQHIPSGKRIWVFCGPGNNGGDGLAITRLLSQKGWSAQAFLLNSKGYLSSDCQTNADRLLRLNSELIREVREVDQLPKTFECDLIVDAIFGTGFRGVSDGLESIAIERINSFHSTVISIDIPSGLASSEFSNITDNKIIKSNHTITFQFLKPALVMPENAPFFGLVTVLDIGLDQRGLQSLSSKFHWVDDTIIKGFLKQREPQAHKGDFGHALLVAGGPGKAGAGILAIKSCLRSGCGLVTAAIPREENPIFQVACPEAMTVTYEESNVAITIPQKTSAIGAGPGIGTSTMSLNTIVYILENWKNPIILDADALNLSSQHHELFSLIPEGSLLTPHVGEFDRLFGKSANDFERLELQREMSKKHRWIILLKGAFTKITTPDGLTFVNPTGNAGMAKGGSGDVLTGLITGLHARGYPLTEAAILGAYLHGLAGDLSAESLGTEAMNASDLVEAIPNAWKKLLQNVNPS